MTRLSDEELSEMERAVQVHKDVRDERMWSTMPYVSSIRVATIEAIVEEIRQSRAAALTGMTEEEREALGFVAGMLRECEPVTALVGQHPVVLRGIAAIDKLLATKGEP